MQNMQGFLLQEVLERCALSAVSQGALASGPGYTFCSGDVRTKVDYILMDVGAASMMASCSTHPMDDLNTSDHLPLTACLSYDACTSTQDERPSNKKIDWWKQIRTVHLMHSQLKYREDWGPWSQECLTVLRW